MSTLAWTRLGYLTRPFRLLRTIISGTSTLMKRQRVYLSPYATLERCSYRLEHLRSLLQAISPQRRRKIQAAADKGACKYIMDLELELDKLYIDYYKLCDLYDEFPFYKRHWPGTRLHQWMQDLEYEIMLFFRDAWTTTTPGDRSINWRTIIEMTNGKMGQQAISRNVLPNAIAGVSWP